MTESFQSGREPSTSARLELEVNRDPGRNEINETQELNYPAIMKAIVDTGYKGYVAQEFIPTWDDKIAALKQGVQICDV